MNEADIAKLYDILDAITKIEKYYTINPAEELRWNMMLRQMQNIGEATTKISEAVKRQAADIPWTKIAATRHILVHAYDGVDPARIMQALQNDVQPLKRAVEALLKALDPDEKFK